MSSGKTLIALILLSDRFVSFLGVCEDCPEDGVACRLRVVELTPEVENDNALPSQCGRCCSLSVNGDVQLRPDRGLGRDRAEQILSQSQTRVLRFTWVLRFGRPAL